LSVSADTDQSPLDDLSGYKALFAEMLHTESDFVISPVEINGNIIDVASIKEGNEDKGLPDPYILIGCRESLGPEENRVLKSAGCAILQYFRENVYLCRYAKDNFRIVRELPFVAWAMNYPDTVVIGPRLKSSISATSFRDRTVNIALHDDVRSLDLEDFVNHLHQKVGIGKTGVQLGRNKIQASIQEQYLDTVASMDAVLSIREASPTALSNDKARDILKANVLSNGTEYKGEIQVVAVADSGFDLGVTDEPRIHPAFRGRILQILRICCYLVADRRAAWC
jgi:hypothetical protein